MCGIIGKVAAPGSGPVSREQLERMCAALEHRGPDARGLFMRDEVGLGIQRLRVIDLVTGDQPVHNEDGTITVVLNGEIYNYPGAAREAAPEWPSPFVTDGDTEVIVHLYEEHGVDCVSHLHGHVRIRAVGRSPAASCCLRATASARSRSSTRSANGAFSFASELRALMEDREINREIDPEAVDCLSGLRLRTRSHCRYSPRCASCRRLSTCLVREARVEIQRYWRLEYSRKLEVNDPRRNYTSR